MSERIYYSREAAERARRERSLLVILSLGLGVSIGAALALLFAPKSGEETRENLREVVEHRSTLQRIEDEFKSLREQVDERLNDIQDRLSS